MDNVYSTKGFKKAYEKIYKEWANKVLKYCFFACIGVLLVEVGMGISMGITGENGLSVRYLLKYIVGPVLVNAVSLAIAYAVIRNEKLTNNTKNWVMVFMMWIICVNLATVHSYFLSSYAFFVAPIVLSLIFMNKFLTKYACVFSIIGIFISFALSGFYDHTWPKSLRLMHVGIAIVIIIVVTMIGHIVIDLYNETEKTMAEAICENVELSHQINTDGLTGLSNHSAFYGTLKTVTSTEQDFALGMLDIDDFKGVNDSYGHDVGDRVLRSVARALKKSVGENGDAFRFGGDEFAVILYTADRDVIEGIFNDIFDKFAEYQKDICIDEKVNISAGVYRVTNHKLNYKTIFSEADDMLYKAKTSGKNMYRIV